MNYKILKVALEKLEYIIKKIRKDKRHVITKEFTAYNISKWHYDGWSTDSELII